MSEQLQPVKAARGQASAVVFAAVITTVGAVVSAVIQTSTTSQPTLSPLTPLEMPEPRNNAARAEPQIGAYGDRNQVAIRPSPRETNVGSLHVASNLPAKLTAAQSTAFHAPATAVETSLQTERLNWNVAKPNLPAANLPAANPQTANAAKPMLSPWYSLSHPETTATTSRPSKKFDWGSITKLFQWHN
jgi:hypothetical protein